jgi:hypothetical protein
MVTTLITSPFALVTSLDSFTTPVTRLGGGNHPGYHPGERAVWRATTILRAGRQSLVQPREAPFLARAL